MTPERWKRVEELFHAARTRSPGERVALLAASCGDDEALRRDVESLLNEVGASGLLDTPAHASAQIGSAVTPAAMSGRELGGYQLQGLLGAGGRGEVYRAHDAKLGREVAIKVLPREFTRDADRLSRFEREARMLAALNHPNICAIYGLEEADGLRFLILERVDGITLAERIQGSQVAGLPIAEVLSIARQIAEALEAAHDKAIVHRDLKPANIKITPDGVVKVLDFGLAKPITADGSAPDLTRSPMVTVGGTREGVILGTAAYMSPEQARGKAIDKRTDIWAFGCVLYEMLTGRVPFDGETVSDTIGKILEREPDWTVLPRTTPIPIRRLLVRCFAKDPKQRLRDIGDVRIEIDAIDEVLPGTSHTAALAPGRSGAAWLPWMAFAALALGVGAWAVRRPATMPDNPLANAKFTFFTNWEGTEEAAEISPDGKFVAFLADREGKFDIWLSQVGTGLFSNLTRDMPPLAPGGVIVRKLGFSGEGSEIWFNPEDRKPLLLMPLMGGTPRAFLGEGANTPAWSPDGTRLVYIYKSNRNDPMYMADRTGADPRQLVPPGTHKINNPVWSADGQWIYFVRGAEPQNETDVDLWRVRSSGGPPERLTEHHEAVNFPAPLDARTVLYVARAEDWSGPWLWALDVESKIARRVSSGVDQYTSVSASRDGRRIVATIANPSASLWRAPLHSDRPDGIREAQPYPLPSPTGRALAPRFGRASLFYLSARGTGDGLWKVRDGETTEVWRDVDRVLSEPAAVSPDEKRVVVVVRDAGKRHLSIMSTDGTDRRTLAPSIEIEGASGQGAAEWSPDGTRIVAGGRDEKGPALFLISADGAGRPVRLVEGNWVNPIWSPDGTLIVYAGQSIVGQVALLGVRPDGTAVDLPRVLVRPGGYRFLPDSTGLVYLPRITALDFCLLDLATKRSHQLTHLANEGTLRTFDITPDGKYIIFDRSRQNSNIVQIDLPR